MTTVVVEEATGGCSSRALKINAIVFGALNLAVCCVSICMLYESNFTISKIYYPTSSTIYGSLFMILINFGMIYVTSRLIFLITVNNFPTEAGVADLHKIAARLVVFSIIGFGAWILSIVWLANFMKDGFDTSDNAVYAVFHACNYGFVLTSVVAGLAGGLLKKIRLRADGSSNIPLQVVAPDPPTTHTRTYPPAQSRGHYNEAYSQPSSYYRR